MNPEHFGYEFLEQLYGSNQTRVFRCRERRSSRLVIVKAPASPWPDEADRCRLRHEFSIGSRFDSPYLSRYLDLQESEEGIILVKEDHGEIGLHQLSLSPADDLDLFLHIAMSLARGLAVLHEQNIIHRDLKPGNILLEEETRSVRITDFSIALDTNHARPYTQDNGPKGSPAYMAPEQSGRLERQVDCRSDLYALGITFYQLMVGRLPYKGKDVMDLIYGHIAQNPVPPREARGKIPEIISRLILQLMAKNPRSRYQSAVGLERDLCLIRDHMPDLEALGHMQLASHGLTPDARLSDVLFGREEELALLMESAERVGRGDLELVVIRGRNGMGKSRLVHEFQNRTQGLFVSGSFQESGLENHFQAFIVVFEKLAVHLSKMPEQDLSRWRQHYGAIFGIYGRLLCDLIPTLGNILGEQPELPELEPIQSRQRLLSTFMGFIGSFCSAEHPLFLFLDDMQWADEQSMELLLHLLESEEIEGLMVVLALREDQSCHKPWLEEFDRLADKGLRVNHVLLKSLSLKATTAWLAHSAGLPREELEEPAALVHQKAQGCPFHIKTILQSLHKKGFIVFRRGRWVWDSDEIRRASPDWDLAGMLADELASLPPDTRQLMADGSCFGQSFTGRDLAALRDEDDAMIAIGMEPALSRGLCWLDNELYSFAHYKIYRAVSRAMPSEERRRRRLDVGRYLLASANCRGKKLAEAVECLNEGIEFIDSAPERLDLARNNLRVAEWALKKLAWADALQLLEMGIRLLPENPWSVEPQLCNALYRKAATAVMGTGKLKLGLEYCRVLLEHEQDPLTRVQVHREEIKINTLQGNYQVALEIGAGALAILDYALPENPRAALMEELDLIDEAIEGRTIESLVDLPEMNDPTRDRLMAVLDALIAPAYFVAQDLLCWIGAAMVRTVLHHGNHPFGSHGFATLAIFLGPIRGYYRKAYEFGALCLSQHKRYGFTDITDTLIFANNLAHWVVPLDEVRVINGVVINDRFSQSFSQYMGYFHMFELFLPFFQGISLNKCRAGIDAARRFMHQTGNLLMIDSVDGFRFGLDRLENAGMDSEEEQRFVERCRANNSMMSLTQYRCLQGLYCLLHGQYQTGLEATAFALENEKYTLGHLSVAETCFYDALLAAAHYRETGDELLLQRIHKHLERMAGWAETCPQTFEAKRDLINAEYQSLSDDHGDVWLTYDRAIAGFVKAHFPHYEALARELAGTYWLRQGKKIFARSYLERAVFLYERWGALGKSQSIEKQLNVQVEGTSSLNTGSHQTGSMDMQIMVKAAQVIAREVDVRACLNKIIRMMMKHAGARRVAILLAEGQTPYVAAYGDMNELRILEPGPLDAMNNLPLSILRYVWRTGREVVLSGDYEQFGDDAYLKRKSPQSLICLPLRHRNRQNGCLYLENDLLTRVFGLHRTAPLQVLLSQAAISLDIARLYSDMSNLNIQLRHEIEERKRAESETRTLNRELEARVSERTAELEEVQRELVEQAHQAGMADIATSVLHNVGNILNSVIVSAQGLVSTVSGLDNRSFVLANEALERVLARLPNKNPKDEMLLQYYRAYDAKMSAGLEDMSEDADQIMEKVEVIRQVVKAQQSYASSATHTELFLVEDVIREARHIIEPTMMRSKIRFTVSGRASSAIPLQKVKLIHVLVNLLKNAEEALAGKEGEPRWVTVEVNQGQGITTITVADSGDGIPEDSWSKIFSQGYTTKPGGHGFGLHSCANSMTEMGGRIWVENGDIGARFHLELPNESKN